MPNILLFTQLTSTYKKMNEVIGILKTLGAMQILIRFQN
jgi:hypothetical protein